ncbi:hypothetical protein BC834DRAFT_154533 [Gloeopeniophorella convolvens]|nr:hypothetical protein BC834DRAFT_154533 [Gloeopeniophorella convolvens]
MLFLLPGVGCSTFILSEYIQYTLWNQAAQLGDREVMITAHWVESRLHRICMDRCSGRGRVPRHGLDWLDDPRDRGIADALTPDTPEMPPAAFAGSSSAGLFSVRLAPRPAVVCLRRATCLPLGAPNNLNEEWKTRLLSQTASPAGLRRASK